MARVSTWSMTAWARARSLRTGTSCGPADTWCCLAGPAARFRQTAPGIRGAAGYLVQFGGASGPVPPFDPIKLSQKGSLFLTRPTLLHYIATREELEQRAGDVLNMVAGGKLKLRIAHIYKLEEAPQAHRDLEGRKTTGKLLLIP